MPKTMGARPLRDALTGYLFTLHEAAMDAAADPQPDNIRAVKAAYRKVADTLPAFYYEEMESKRAIAATTEQP